MNTHCVGVEVVQHDDHWNLQLTDGLLGVNHTGSYNIRVQHLPFLTTLKARRGGGVTVGVAILGVVRIMDVVWSEGVVTVSVMRSVGVV